MIGFGHYDDLGLLLQFSPPNIMLTTWMVCDLPYQAFCRIKPQSFTLVDQAPCLIQNGSFLNSWNEGMPSSKSYLIEGLVMILRVWISVLIWQWTNKGELSTDSVAQRLQPSWVVKGQEEPVVITPVLGQTVYICYLLGSFCSVFQPTWNMMGWNSFKKISLIYIILTGH